MQALAEAAVEDVDDDEVQAGEAPKTGQAGQQRWTVCKDNMLLQQIKANPPFLAEHRMKTTQWEEVSAALKKAFPADFVHLDGRKCRDHWRDLRIRFVSTDGAKRRKTGTDDEPYDKFDELITELVALSRDAKEQADEIKVKTEAAKQEKEEKGAIVRAAATVGGNSRKRKSRNETMSEIAEAAKSLGNDKSHEFYEVEKMKLEVEKSKMEQDLKKLQLQLDADREERAERRAEREARERREREDREAREKRDKEERETRDKRDERFVQVLFGQFSKNLPDWAKPPQ